MIDFLLTPRKDHAFVFDVTDRNRRRISKDDFLRRFGEEMQSQKDRYRTPEKASDRIAVVVEGDSWTNLLWPASRVFGYNRNFTDVIELERDIDVKNFGWPGDTLQNIVAKKDYKSTLQAAQREYFVFSAAGNDILGGGAIKKLVRKRTHIDPRGAVASWIIYPEMNNALRRIAIGYRTVARECEVWTNGKTQMLVHGYDYPIARAGGAWLGRPFAELGYDLIADAHLIARILNYLVDQLYRTLEGVAAAHSTVHVMDLRGTVKGGWTDELHTKKAASEAIANVFLNFMRRSRIS